jgi:hypothetical protein
MPPPPQHGRVWDSGGYEFIDLAQAARVSSVFSLVPHWPRAAQDSVRHFFRA